MVLNWHFALAPVFVPGCQKTGRWEKTEGNTGIACGLTQSLVQYEVVDLTAANFGYAFMREIVADFVEQMLVTPGLDVFGVNSASMKLFKIMHYRGAMISDLLLVEPDRINGIIKEQRFFNQQNPLHIAIHPRMGIKKLMGKYEKCDGHAFV